jgi:hypothetical protein
VGDPQAEGDEETRVMALGIAIAGLAVLSAAGVGIGVSFWFEVTKGEPIYMAAMKIAAFAVGVGGVLIGVGIAGMG